MSNEYGNDYITLTDEDGREIEFEHIGTVELDGMVYVGLIEQFVDPKAQLESDGKLFILKAIEDEGGDEILVTIDDANELKRVADEFQRVYEDEMELDTDQQ